MYKEEDEPKLGLDKDLVISSRMEQMKWLAKRPKDSSLDTSKVSGYVKKKTLDLDMASEIFKSELKNIGW
jgi:dTDP-4-dehydrorhamnose reductase